MAKIYSHKSWSNYSKKLSSKKGKRVWTRQLVEVEISNGYKERVFYPKDNAPNFRCTFIREIGDKHILVVGPDGNSYIVHKCYAGKNPACSISFDGKYRPVGRRISRFKPGTSFPNDSTLVIF